MDSLSFKVYGGNQDEILVAARRVIRDYIGLPSFDELPDFRVSARGMSVMTGQIVYFEATVEVDL